MANANEMLAKIGGHMEVGQYAEAEVICKNILQSLPDNVHALNYMGAISSKVGRHDMALAFFHKAHKVAPDSAQIIENMAGSLYEMGELEKSAAFYQRALLLNDKSGKAYDGLGLSCMKMDRDKEAEGFFKKAISLDEKSWVAALHLGDLYRKINNINRSVEFYEKALSLQPENAAILQNLAALLSDTGRQNEAMPYYEKARQIEPQNILIYSNMLSCLFSLGRYLDIQDDMAATEDSDIFSAEYLSSLHVLVALTFFLEGKIGDAEQTLKKAQPLKTTDKNIPDIKGMKVYLAYMEKLIAYHAGHPELYKGEANKKIHIIGESHSMSFAHTYTKPFGSICVPHLVMGAKARHLGQEGQNRFKAGVNRAIEKLPEKSTALMCFGEIDCRIDEGIFAYYKKNPETGVQKNIIDIIDRYVDYVLREASGRGISVYFCGVPAIAKDVSSFSEKDQKTLAFVVRFFNEYLSDAAANNGCGFVDVYAETASETGFAKKGVHIDSYHLCPHVALNALNEAVSNI